MLKNVIERPLRYHTLIFCLWQEAGDLPNEAPIWRFSLENPHTAERRGFKNLTDLTIFLNGWVAGKSEQLLSTKD